MDIYTKPKNIQTRWASFENPKAEKGAGGMGNRGGKGHASRLIQPGETVELLNYQGQGSGVIRRIWATVDKYRSPYALRAMLIQMYWDGCHIAAVSAPFGDFFGEGAGRKAPFECELFEDPEGRSFNCFIPMPFKTGAKITVTNESNEQVMLFYDVNFTIGDIFDESTMYFHAYWHREHTRLMKDFEILPEVRGNGRYLGANFSVIENPDYNGVWFGEGEVKIYLDGDKEWPTLVGTGTEDFIGTAWGQGIFAGRYQGCLYHDGKKREWTFYRYHVADPVYFDADCRVAMQQMGGAPGDEFRKVAEKGVAMEIAAVAMKDGKYLLMFEEGDAYSKESVLLDGNWYNFFREDDVAACAYFYLDAPVNTLPEIQGLSVRTETMASE